MSDRSRVIDDLRNMGIRLNQLPLNTIPDNQLMDLRDNLLKMKYQRDRGHFF